MSETKIKYKEITNDENFEDEIKEINSYFFKINSKNFQYNDILQIIKKSISGYLIICKIEPRKITKDEIIELRDIGMGSLSKIVLSYYIEYEKLVVIKKYISLNPEVEKLMKREIENYEEIQHPFIPKFYGKIQYNDLSYPVIEFINGKTLLNTNFSQFSESEIYEIILQMLLVINYLHNKHFIYRDLKPNNVIIDDSKTLVLIDFDINKALYYFSLVANQNYPQAQYNLGIIYYSGQYIPRDINKSIYYYSLAANQNDPQVLYNLGIIYEEGQYIPRDINKSIYYYSLAANLKYPLAQFNLGLIYFLGIGVNKNIKKGIYWIIQSSNNDCIQAHFALGFLYQEGKYMKQNIEESIKLYKKASSFNYQYAKNNLGIIYKNNNENKYDYTVYFEEAIRQKNDPVSMYNLSHAYIYEYQDEKLINKSIELLIKSSNLGFKPSEALLILIILKRFFSKQTNEKYQINNIRQELSKLKIETSEIIYLINNIIQEQQLYKQSTFEYYYKKYEEIEFVYDLYLSPVCIKYLYKEEKELKLEDFKEEYNITSAFYEGFGYDIYQK
ncbi:hypothetical protein M9Y10_013592 [Tritrichomonas musculus]|uniref:Protein kinase domain-containing protein n=1 Tax=Tritrichomonas musculus TaxID=1915356 RepID=A0ABR2KXD1_9EUKA